MKYYFNEKDARIAGVMIALVDDNESWPGCKAIFATVATSATSVHEISDEEIASSRFAGSAKSEQASLLGDTVTGNLTELGRAYCKTYGVEPNLPSLAKWVHNNAMREDDARNLYGDYNPM